MDLSTILGILLGLILIGGAIAMGGDIVGFINIPSFMITFGGTVAATMVMFPLKTVMNAMKVAQVALREPKDSPLELIEKIVSLAQKARRESILALENEPIEDPFLQKGIRLVVDGAEPDFIKAIMRTEIAMMQERHKSGQKVFKGMGAFAPAFGMIGTLIGLVQMLRAIDDPQKIGPAMAVALITTLYGAVAANLVFLPIASKLEERSRRETILREMMLEGVLAILAGENPRMIREKLLSFLPPSMRGEEHGGKKAA